VLFVENTTLFSCRIKVLYILRKYQDLQRDLDMEEPIILGVYFPSSKCEKHLRIYDSKKRKHSVQQRFQAYL